MTRAHAKTLLAAAGLVASAAGHASAGPAFVCDLPSVEAGDRDRMQLTFVVTVAPTRERHGEGMVIGNAGSAAIVVTKSTGGLNFLEFTISGNIQLVTVAVPDALPVTVVSSSATYPMLYSRHTILPDFSAEGQVAGQFIPQQFLGTCTLKN